MPFRPTYNTRKFPFIRLLAALIAGIMLQWYLQPPAAIAITALLAAVTIAAAGYNIPLAQRFRWNWLFGLLILLCISAIGALLTYTSDIRNQPGWYGHRYAPGDTLVLIVQEPPEAKPNSYKALANITALCHDGRWSTVSGKLLLYFSKDNLPEGLGYGSVIQLHKPIQAIRNSGNPGAFDYERYCLFHQVTGQVYIKSDEYVLAPQKQFNPLRQTIFTARDAVVHTLKRYIPGGQEQAVAAALLIGYRNDLDKDLVQAYSNTGVVHIIAISGLHLGMIYGLMVALFAPVKRYKAVRWIRPIVILVVLWAFALVAGAAPSIVRSAVMFTFIVVAEMVNRKTNMYNTLAAAAFCMLVQNPFILWDVGFQLSFAAVISIVTFMMPVYRWYCFRSVIADKIWAMTAVTLSAQVFTLPLVLYYFHQFPVLFLVTNFIAVPLSGLILYAEILLVCLAPVQTAANWLGQFTGALIRFMNRFITAVNELPYTVVDQLQFSVFEVWMLFGCIIATAVWLMQRKPAALPVALLFAVVLAGSNAAGHITAVRQQKLVVYHVPKFAATDIIQGRQCTFIGDTALLGNSFLRNFHIRPGRILFRTNNVAIMPAVDALHSIRVGGKTLVMVTGPLPPAVLSQKIRADVLILSHNPRIYISQLTDYFDVGLLVADGSNPLWKTELWKKDCENLHLRFHSTAQQGAFVMDL